MLDYYILRFFNNESKLFSRPFLFEYNSFALPQIIPNLILASLLDLLLFGVLLASPLGETAFLHNFLQNFPIILTTILLIIVSPFFVGAATVLHCLQVGWVEFLVDWG